MSWQFSEVSLAQFARSCGRGRPITCVCFTPKPCATSSIEFRFDMPASYASRNFQVKIKIPTLQTSGS
jgi:hypothetical protein